MNYIVIDLEMSPASKELKKTLGKSREIIQLGAVLLDDAYQEISSFCKLVKPQYMQMDAYTTALTGITDAQLTGEAPLAAALSAFAAWLPVGETTAVSWSMADHTQLFGEMHCKGIRNVKIEYLFSHWVDCQALYSKMYNTSKRYRLEDALSMEHISIDGSLHNALTDAKLTGQLLRLLLFGRM